ncbi:MAG: SCO family protein [Steroidobacteraceae bacterium]
MSTVSTVPMRRLWILVALAACAALAGYWLAHQLDREAPTLASGTWLPTPKALVDFHLIDDGGRPYTSADLLSAPTLVYFGFTHCPDVCPTTLVKLAQIQKQAALPALRVVLVSVDPQRDTPAVLSRYVHAFDAAFRGLTGSPEEIARVARNFGVAVNRVDLPGGDYTMDHSAIVFLVSRAGVVAIFTPPFDAPAFAADLRRAAPFLAPRRDWPLR